MKKTGKVVCKSVGEAFGLLTVDKEYEVVEYGFNTITIKADDGHNWWFSPAHFYNGTSKSAISYERLLDTMGLGGAPVSIGSEETSILPSCGFYSVKEGKHYRL